MRLHTVWAVIDRTVVLFDLPTQNTIIYSIAEQLATRIDPVPAASLECNHYTYFPVCDVISVITMYL